MRYLKLLLIFIVALAGFILLLNIRSVVSCVSHLWGETTDRIEPASSPSHEKEPTYVPDAIEMSLDSPAIRLKEVDVIDRSLTQQYAPSLHPYSYRVQALRAILLCIMQDTHSASSINSVITLYADNLSEEQKQILYKYLSLGKTSEERWLRSRGMCSLEEFNKTVNHEE